MNARCWIVVTAVALFPACGDGAGGEPAPAADAHGHAGHDHAHDQAPHGGTIVVVGDEEAHVEFRHDPEAGTLVVWVLGPDVKTAVMVEPPVLTVATGGPALQLPLVPTNPGADGRASGFVLMHDALKKDPIEGRLRLQIGDKTFNPSLAREP